MDAWMWLGWVTLICGVVVVAYFAIRPRRDDFASVDSERRRLRELGKAAGWRS